MVIVIETLSNDGTKAYYSADKVSEKLELNREHLLFRVEPRISYVSDDFAEADPEFWRGKPDASR